MSGAVVARDGRAVLTPEQALRLAGDLGGGAFERDGIGVVVEELTAEPLVVIDGFGGEERFASLDALLASGWTSIAVPFGERRSCRGGSDRLPFAARAQSSAGGTMTGPRDVLAAIGEAKPPWEAPEPLALSALSVTQAAMAPEQGQVGLDPRLRVGLQPWDVAALREASGLTQALFGAILGVDGPRLGRLERGSLALTALENEVLNLLRLTLEPMVNESDRHAWARGVAERARQQGRLLALLQVLADGGLWRQGAHL